MIGFDSNRTMMAAFKSLDIELPFSKKPAMEGAGSGVGEVYAWAIENPDKVSCVYAENPRMYSALAKTQPLENLVPLAKANVPLLHVCGSLDQWFKDNTLEVEKRYQKLGGKIQVIVKQGAGHYPLAPEDPARLWTLSPGQLGRGNRYQYGVHLAAAICLCSRCLNIIEHQHAEGQFDRQG
jgi:hypothetical protein